MPVGGESAIGDKPMTIAFFGEDVIGEVPEMILQHHERLDGSGYPRKLRAGEIILEARILGVSDVIEAMSSHRPYRPTLGMGSTLEHIIANKGILYDPEVVDACVRLIREKGFQFK